MTDIENDVQLETCRDRYETGGETAINYFEDLVEQEPLDKSGYFYLKLLYTESGDIRNALKSAKKLAQINSIDVNQYLNTGAIYEAAGTYDKAIEYYRREMKMHPDNPYVYLALGRVYFKKRKWGKSARNLKKFLLRQDEVIEWDVAEGRQYLAQVYYATHRLQQEIEIYKNMLNVDPDDIYALRNLGAAHIDAQNYAAALEFLRRAEERNGSDASIDRNLIKAQRGLLRAAK